MVLFTRSKGNRILSMVAEVGAIAGVDGVIASLNNPISCGFLNFGINTMDEGRSLQL
jgi:hypothetical protein